MLSKKNKIDKHLFKEVFEQGKKYNSNFFSIRIFPIEEKNTRFSFVVPVRVSKKAVVRNKMKRRGRYIVSKVIYSIKEGFALIVFFKKESEKVDFDVLEKDLLSILRKTKVL